MLRIFTIVAVLITAADIGSAQEQPSYTLRFTAEQLQAVWNALHKAPLPREATDAVVGEIQKQVAVQNEARAKATRELADKK